MLDRFGSWDSTRDSKINALVDLLLPQRPSWREGSGFHRIRRWPAEYVAQALQEAGVEKVAVVSGNTDDPADIARRFSPQLQPIPGCRKNLLK